MSFILTAATQFNCFEIYITETVPPVSIPHLMSKLFTIVPNVLICGSPVCFLSPTLPDTVDPKRPPIKIADPSKSVFINGMPMAIFNQANHAGTYSGFPTSVICGK
ncbi:MAG: hypothetical protein N4A49_14660 [Marinifilaceae bacterium]|jgi:hypothetical protein|nr:hypothetical protein [Marinifilaceae bacterium]